MEELEDDRFPAAIRYGDIFFLALLIFWLGVVVGSRAFPMHIVETVVIQRNYTRETILFDDIVIYKGEVFIFKNITIGYLSEFPYNLTVSSSTFLYHYDYYALKIGSIVEIPFDGILHPIKYEVMDLNTNLVVLRRILG